MSRLVVEEFMSLDGVIQAPGHAAEDPRGFAHGGWSQPFFGDHRRRMPASFAAAGALLFGRATYEEFAAYWPTVVDRSDALGDALNTLPKHVVTSRPTRSGWEPTSVVDGDLATAVTELAARTDGDLLVVGSARLASSLVALDLVDVFRLWVHPVVLGSGTHLMPRRETPMHLELIDHHVTDSGVVILTYTRAQALAGAAAA